MLNHPPMGQGFAIRLGDVVQMRKPHACGADQWVVVRIGADVRIRCTQCGRAVLMPRARFARAARKLLSSDGAEGSPR